MKRIRSAFVVCGLVLSSLVVAGDVAGADSLVGVWSPTGSTSVGRIFATTTRLDDGDVLVAGGDNNNVTLSSAELYDPASGTWSPTGSLNDPRSGAVSTLLADGRVLVVGGTYNTGHGASVSLSSADAEPVGALPKRITFQAGTFSGTPKAGTAGIYPITLTARNGFGTATQTFVLTVT